MAKWYVKELSKLTNVSVQTLHYYDRIDLLKPSLRLENGYRLYSEMDLLRLQQIIALKFFNFELEQIKNILEASNIEISTLQGQVKALAKRAKRIQDASDTLQNIVEDLMPDGSIPWESVIETIEVYNMTEKLEHEWVKDIFTQEELKEYAEFERSLTANATQESKTKFEKSWQALVLEVQGNLDQDPKSDLGIDLGKRLMEWVNSVYGKKYAHLRTKKFEKGFGEGKGLEETGMTPEIVAWMDQAMDAYWRDRIYSLLDKVGSMPEEKLSFEWNEVLDDMYGDQNERKLDLVQIALQDDKISKEAKSWLKALK